MACIGVNRQSRLSICLSIWWEEPVKLYKIPILLNKQITDNNNNNYLTKNE